ncbi:hypothetical protein [Variovorax sp. EBFNA2]|uniref:hypothetical protein n=1 Tax=Variovorax sp. EBFNA2 TaxID=3342097 RepID=UPI0029C0EC02|nr:hypothetical protein [Variovorax boronicumulans]WPG40181.1 hypothetical protein RZE79_12780 [Variovorax boronicumulans]
MKPTDTPPTDPARGGQRVQPPDAVNGEEPAVAPRDAQGLRRAMRDATGRDAPSPEADSPDALKRRAARGTPRENDAGA